jgi:hypothetical protein
MERLRPQSGPRFHLADAVMEREGRASTNTGEGVAFRTRTDLVDHLILGIGRNTPEFPSIFRRTGAPDFPGGIL